MRRSLFAILACVAVAYAAFLAGMFLLYAVVAIGDASRIGPAGIARFGSPMGEIGVGVGAVMAGLGVLIASVRYLIVPRISEVLDARPPPRR